MIKDVASADSLEIALIENIQREDLNPVETAEAFHRLMKDYNLTQEELSSRVGKERATVANYLRLLKLPDEIKTFVNDETLSMGHARAILSIEGKPNQIEAARKIITRMTMQPQTSQRQSARNWSAVRSSTRSGSRTGAERADGEAAMKVSVTARHAKFNAALKNAARSKADTARRGT